jgi:diketogulonate reductase-like aldo/keto reductase
MIDTASAYGNEDEVGRAIRESGIPRNQLWIQTKLSPKEMGSKTAVVEAFHRSRAKLGLEYIDCYMMHWPAASGKTPTDPEQVKLRRDAYAALLELRNQGYIRHVGVSNFLARHLQSLEPPREGERSEKPHLGSVPNTGGGAPTIGDETAPSSTDPPFLNQIELHPLCHQQAVVDYCRSAGIRVQSYSPLGRGEILHNEKVVSTAKELSNIASSIQSEMGSPITPSDAVLWLGLMERYQGGYIVRSSSPLHIQANFRAWKVWESYLSQATRVDGIPPPPTATPLVPTETSSGSSSTPSYSHKRGREGDDEEERLKADGVGVEGIAIADHLIALQNWFSDCRVATHQRQLVEGSEFCAANPRWVLGDQGDLHYCWWSGYVSV